MPEHGLDTVLYREPYFSEPRDVPKIARKYGGTTFNPLTTSTASLPTFAPPMPPGLHRTRWGRPAGTDTTGQAPSRFHKLAVRPPSRAEAEAWLKSHPAREAAVEKALDERPGEAAGSDEEAVGGSLRRRSCGLESAADAASLLEGSRSLSAVAGGHYLEASTVEESRVQADAYDKIKHRSFRNFPSASVGAESRAPPQVSQASPPGGGGLPRTATMMLDPSHAPGPSRSFSNVKGASLEEEEEARRPSQVSEASLHEKQHLGVLSIELQCATRGDMLPDPAHDAIEAVCFILAKDGGEGGRLQRLETGVLFCESSGEAAAGPAGGPGAGDPAAAPESRYGFGEPNWKVESFASEADLILDLARIVRETDPDIICSFDIMKGGWGYLFDRATQIGLAAADGQTMKASFSRVAHWRHPPERSDDWGAKTTSDVHLVGRISLNLWRIIKGEVDLRMYHFEAAASKVLQRRYPHFSPRQLQRLFLQGGRERHRCVRYWMRRTQANLDFLEALDVIGVQSELARVYGIDFYSVLSRGSQYRVESMLYRLAKPHG